LQIQDLCTKIEAYFYFKTYEQSEDFESIRYVTYIKPYMSLNTFYGRKK